MTSEDACMYQIALEFHRYQKHEFAGVVSLEGDVEDSKRGVKHYFAGVKRLLDIASFKKAFAAS